MKKLLLAAMEEAFQSKFNESLEKVKCAMAFISLGIILAPPTLILVPVVGLPLQYSIVFCVQRSDGSGWGRAHRSGGGS